MHNTFTQAIRIHRFGGPEVLQWEEIPLSPPAPGEATIRQTAIGLNFIDTYHRSGLYPLTLPAVRIVKSFEPEGRKPPMNATFSAPSSAAASPWASPRPPSGPARPRSQ